MSAREQAYDKILREWATKWKADHLTPEVRTLISQATFDLYNGPINDGAYGDPAEGDEELQKYPGFTVATRTISQALTHLPSDLYLDTETGEIRETEPEGERCYACQGEGYIIAGHRVECEFCNGRGGFDPAGDWWHVEAPDVRQAIVGKELSEYVR